MKLSLGIWHALCSLGRGSAHIAGVISAAEKGTARNDSYNETKGKEFKLLAARGPRAAYKLVKRAAGNMMK
jgi:hypothetical protein